MTKFQEPTGPLQIQATYPPKVSRRAPGRFSTGLHIHKVCTGTFPSLVFPWFMIIIPSTSTSYFNNEGNWEKQKQHPYLTLKYTCWDVKPRRPGCRWWSLQTRSLQKKTCRGSQTRSGFCAASQILMCWPLGGPGVVVGWLVGWLVVCCLRCSGGLNKKRRYNLNVYTLACIASLFDKNGELNSNLGDWPIHLLSKNKHHNHGLPSLPCPYQWCMLYSPEWMVDFNGKCRDILTGLGKNILTHWTLLVFFWLPERPRAVCVDCGWFWLEHVEHDSQNEQMDANGMYIVQYTLASFQKRGTFLCKYHTIHTKNKSSEWVHLPQIGVNMKTDWVATT